MKRALVLVLAILLVCSGCAATPQNATREPSSSAATASGDSQASSTNGGFVACLQGETYYLTDDLHYEVFSSDVPTGALYRIKANPDGDRKVPG